MSYRDKYGITQIIPTDRDNLSISWDCDDDESIKSQRVAMFLYTPDMNDTSTPEAGTEHYHIELDQEQAAELHKWLGEFLKDVRVRDEEFR